MKCNYVPFSATAPPALWETSGAPAVRLLQTSRQPGPSLAQTWRQT